MNLKKLILAIIVTTGSAMLCLALIWIAMQPPALPVPERSHATIRDVTLVNPGLERQDHVDIEIAGGRIVSVGPASTDRRPGDITCRGCFALPGLMDMHAHLPPRAAIGNERLFSLMFLANGVTTIRELGSADGSAYDVRDEIEAGAYPGPRVISCGRVLDGDPPTRSNNVVVRTPAEGRAEVIKAASRGARCIKLYNMLRKDVVLAIADEAARHNMPIVAHVPHSVSLTDAPYIRDVQHFTGVPVPRDATKVGIDDYLNSDFASLTRERMVEVVDAALRLNTIHTPALINEDVRRTLGAPTRFPPHPQLDALPSFWNQVWRGIWHAPNLGHEAVVYEGFREKERELLRMMFDRGVTVFAGTDTLMPFVAPGASLVQELQNFVAVGRTPEQALVTATTSPGTFWNDRTFGRIRSGLPADLVLYERDPTLDLGNLETRRWVIADGRIYDALQLKRWLDAYRVHFHAWPYETVMNIAIGFLSGDYAKGTSDK